MMSKNPPIFVVSLKRDNTRRQHITAHLQQHGLSHEIIDAVDGRELSEAQIAAVYSLEKTMQHIKRPLSKGEIACALSHFSIWQKMCDEDIAEAIIVEDDAVLHENFMEKVQEAKKILPQDWQILLLGYAEIPFDLIATFKQRLCHIKIAQCKQLKIIKPLEMAWCTHCYLLNQSGARHLLAQIKMLTMPIDSYTGDYNFMRVYCVMPRCAGINPVFQSDIRDHVVLKSREKTLWNRCKDGVKKCLPWLDPLLVTLKFHYFCGIKLMRYYLNRRS